MTADLIKRLEAATGPDRELDEAIACHLGMVALVGNAATVSVGFVTADGKPSFGPPAFTSSLDAALTLVPDGPHDKEMYWGGVDGACLAQIESPWDHFHQGRHKHIAIALCIAALKARNIGEAK